MVYQILFSVMTVQYSTSLSVISFVPGSPRWSHSSDKCSGTKRVLNTARTSFSGWPIDISRKTADLP